MRTIISASRRTDIPAFYMRWFEYHIKQGYVDVRNPVVKHRTYKVNLVPEEVHSIVLWSKNFKPFLDSNVSKSNLYQWYFNFSLVDCPQWELDVPPIEERLQQVKEICSRWSPQQINWRFDPIIFWDEGRRNNLPSFFALCDFMASQGVNRCTFSFVTWYNKVKKREAANQLKWYDPPLQQKLDVVSELSAYARARGVIMESCCNDDLLKAEGVVRGRCINGPLLSERFGERCTKAKDTSQRADCGCTKSLDIGSYAMSCPHGCAYCYAKPIRNSRLSIDNQNQIMYDK